MIAESTLYAIKSSLLVEETNVKYLSFELFILKPSIYVSKTNFFVMQAVIIIIINKKNS